ARLDHGVIRLSLSPDLGRPSGWALRDLIVNPAVAAARVALEAIPGVEHLAALQWAAEQVLPIVRAHVQQQRRIVLAGLATAAGPIMEHLLGILRAEHWLQARDVVLMVAEALDQADVYAVPAESEEEERRHRADRAEAEAAAQAPAPSDPQPPAEA